MTSKERVLASLQLEKPDRIPFVELTVDNGFAAKFLGTPATTFETQSRFSDLPVLSVPTIGATFSETKNLSERLDLDAVGISFWIKHLGLGEEIGGRQIFTGGSISTLDDVKSIRFPDPHDQSLYEPLEQFLEEFSTSDRALYCVSNLGSDPVILGLGFENFSLSIYINRNVVEEMLRLYFDWQGSVFEHLCKMDFDFLWTTDDIAYKTSTYISPDDIRELFLPGYRQVASSISKPWVYHSDGDLSGILDDLIPLGMNGIHPIEPGPMNLYEVKQQHGDKICPVGHIDINVLSEGTPDQVDNLVKEAINIAGRDGGYICGSSNSITSYCKPENVIALQKAIQKYGIL